jgi:hypothetical protein
MNITSAQFESDDNGDNVSIQATIEEQVLSVPLDPANRHYAEILKQVADGTITIADAD